MSKVHSGVKGFLTIKAIRALSSAGITELVLLLVWTLPHSNKKNEDDENANLKMIGKEALEATSKKSNDQQKFFSSSP